MPPRFADPALHIVVIRRKGERDVGRQRADRCSRRLGADSQTADHNGDARPLVGRRGRRVSGHGCTAVIRNARQRALLRLLDQCRIGNQRLAGHDRLHDRARHDLWRQGRGGSVRKRRRGPGSNGRPSRSQRGRRSIDGRWLRSGSGGSVVGLVCGCGPAQFERHDGIAVARTTEIGHGSEQQKHDDKHAEIGQCEGVRSPPRGTHFAVRHAVRGHGAT